MHCTRVATRKVSERASERNECCQIKGERRMRGKSQDLATGSAAAIATATTPAAAARAPRLVDIAFLKVREARVSPPGRACRPELRRDTSHPYRGRWRDSYLSAARRRVAQHMMDGRGNHDVSRADKQLSARAHQHARCWPFPCSSCIGGTATTRRRGTLTR